MKEFFPPKKFFFGEGKFLYFPSPKKISLEGKKKKRRQFLENSNISEII
jgi:hypothetical protein